MKNAHWMGRHKTSNPFPLVIGGDRYTPSLLPETGNGFRVYGEVFKLTNVDYTSGLPVFSVGGSKILFLRLDFIIVNKQLGGAHHRLILMNPDGSNQEQLIPDDRYTPTLEYFDW